MLCIFFNSCVLARGSAVLVQCCECTSLMQLYSIKAASGATKTTKHSHSSLFIPYRFTPWYYLPFSPTQGISSRSMKQHRAFYLTRSKLRELHDTSTYIKPPVETGKST